ncbi:MAG: membrane protein insertion efficiency factor YidD [Spartobacteria bacterium]|nr:membrane protein insertion efficiency factor YidD [Spartobacteria bacterium]
MIRTALHGWICVLVYATGTLFCLLTSSSVCAAEPFAQQLFDQQQWKDARREAQRELLRSSGQPDMRFIVARCGLQLTNQVTASLIDLEQLYTDPTVPMRVRVASAYALGQWNGGHNEVALAAGQFKFGFQHAQTQQQFLQSGCALGMLLNQHRELISTMPEVELPLLASRELWSPELRQASRIPLNKADAWGVLAWPGRMVVAFYRFGVSPALGARCSLEPSCSEYFRQASLKHGLLGIPIQADRFYREPSVVSHGGNEVLVNGTVRYADPLSDHDFWFNKGKKDNE